MNQDDIIDKIKHWIRNNGSVFTIVVSLSFLVFGILVVVGSVRNWDWLYKPDAAYHNKWTIGQISRYLGRDTARALGFVGGLILIFAGAIWSYLAIERR